MVNSPKIPQPTEAELAILEVLWEAGAGTVREVHDTLHRTGKARTGYTTVLKLMQIMARKGLVDRDESNRSHVYVPTCSREDTQTDLVGDLIQRAFAGSASQLVLRALSSNRASREELDAIRSMLDEHEAAEEGGRS